MKVSALTAYVDQKNRWNSIFKGKQYEFQSRTGRQEIARMLDADLSPENLTCDGELSRVITEGLATTEEVIELTAKYRPKNS